jgi:hypothetical protein
LIKTKNRVKKITLEVLVFYWFIIASTIPDDSLEDGSKKYSNISCVVFILGFGVFVQQLSYFFLPTATELYYEISVILHHLKSITSCTYIGIILWYIFVPKSYIEPNSNLASKCSSSTNIAMTTF